MVRRFLVNLSMAGALASAMLFMTCAYAMSSPMSLAERVARLEQQQQNQVRGRVDELDQWRQMQSSMQAMQEQIEVLQHQLQQLQAQSKDRYLDLDHRMSRLEKQGNASVTPSPSASAPALAASSVAQTQASTPVAPAGTADQRTAALDAYNAAFKSLRGGDYLASSRLFREFIQRHPNDALVPNAFYWLGESYYATTNYQVAVEAFRHLLSQYPQSEKAPDAMLKLGYSQLKMKKTDEGTATLQSVASEYPHSNAAKLAQERLRQLSQQRAW